MTRKRKGEVPVLREVVARDAVPARAKPLPNLDLFADAANGIPDPNALRTELAAELTRRIEEYAHHAARDMERKLVDRLHHELPSIIERTLRDHFAKK